MNGSDGTDGQAFRNRSEVITGAASGNAGVTASVLI